MAMKKFPVGPAEKIRNAKGLDPEQFSVSIGFNFSSYQKALDRGTITYRMAREISMRYHVPLSELEDGSHT